MKREIAGLYRKFIWTIGFWLLLLVAAVPVCASEGGGFRLEQARVYMPDIRLYYYPGTVSGTGDEITASLDDEKLTVINTYPCSEDIEGTDFYILVDISKSIGKGYFAAVKEALKQFPAGMNENDTLTLLSFGNEVSVLTERAGKNDNIQGVVDGLDNNDDNTHLFEAFDRTEEIADREEYISRRIITIVITDGEDCSTNESTKTTALENLQKIGMPVYAMAVKQTANGNDNTFVEDFGDFVRATNGSLFLFGEDEAVDTILNIQSMVYSAQVLELKASSNKITSVIQPLTVLMPGSGSEAIQICPRYSQKDNETPGVSIARTGEKELTLTFSEAVVNAGEASSYQVQRDEEQLPIYVVNYSEAGEYTAVLSFSEPLEAGEYTVAFQNISDKSMEQNQLTEPVVLHIEEETESETVTETPVQENDGGIPLVYFAVAAGAVILIIIAVIVVAGKKKKHRESEPEPEAESLLNQSVLTLEVRGEASTRSIKAPIQERLVVGRRSADCDIALQDEQMSRKHFSIEKDSGCFYIMDLGSTNGTMLNGIEINDRCKLKNGDVVQAGSFYITISW